MEIVRLALPDPNEDVVQELERILEQARSGEIQSFICVKLRSDGCFAVNQSGAASCLQFAGALAFAMSDLIRANNLILTSFPKNINVH